VRPEAEQRRRLAVAGAAALCALLATAADARAPDAPPRHAAAPPVSAAATRAAGRSAQATPSGAAVVVPDPRDAPGGLDLTRVQLGRADDGRLRAALTLATAWRMRDLPADDGPPGSLCLRMWTSTEPPGTFPDRLLCVTADARGRHMRGEVFAERAGALVRIANATLARSSDRTVVARFSQSAIGRPARVRFAGEATAPGCATPACVDTAPNAPTVATLELRSR
jgi:hypothetical protein